ncbi:putative zinc-binding metallopeptidase [Sphingobacterium sp. SRCM116780]|uniref:zinc-binding metallopeptidase n=1 Tax=Sphingobacterium sp. SRCM116780 TaxID=2907623 RepID=UPI001F42EECC|nr:putative zinc-binding metallopeptidase [Sphingobacterium sp. SRCM116780]UIR56265.1 putative zinc-binding metallopeptidase [Sphingobacterium sp. SRCM116780]
MKRKLTLMMLGMVLLGTISCNKEDKLDANSVFVDSEIEQNEFDKYIYTNFTKPYNIDILYKYVDRESDLDYNLVPAPYESSIRMTKLLSYLGLEPYNDLTGSKEFIRKYFPKLLNYIGSVAVRNNGTVVLGTAENGAKMSLYNLLDLNAETGQDKDYLNYYYFKTVHHEFQHILNQTKPFPSDFRAITGLTYVDDAWNTVYPNSAAGNANAISAGYISPYASKAAEEDFAELYSFYITRSQADFNAMLNIPGATDAGKAIVIKKLNVVKTYMRDNWNIDMDKLRENIIARMDKLDTFDQTSLN